MWESGGGAHIWSTVKGCEKHPFLAHARIVLSMCSIVPSTSSVCERTTHGRPFCFAVSFLSFHFFPE